jgi:hypothetical protein
MNNTGAAYWLVYSFGFLFILGIMFIIFNQILINNLYPVTEEITNISTHDTSRADRWLGFWYWFPGLALLVVLIFLFVKIANKQQEVG